MTPQNNAKPQTMIDLASSRKPVDVYIRAVDGQNVIKNATISYVKRGWVGVEYSYRGVRHKGPIGGRSGRWEVVSRWGRWSRSIPVATSWWG